MLILDKWFKSRHMGNVSLDIGKEERHARRLREEWEVERLGANLGIVGDESTLVFCVMELKRVATPLAVDLAHEWKARDLVPLCRMILETMLSLVTVTESHSNQ